MVERSRIKKATFSIFRRESLIPHYEYCFETKVAKFSHMHKTPKGVRYGGREKGTLNKATQDLHDKAKELGVDPFEILLLFAKRDHEALGLPEYTMKVVGRGEDSIEIEELTISPELQQKSAKDACEYLHPKRKAIEHKLETDTGKSLEEYLSGLNAAKENT